MKKIITLLLMISGNVYAQEKYTIYSIPYLDSLGNQYTVKKSYNHIPTAADSADFLKESKISILQMMDDNLKPTETKVKNNKLVLKKRKKKAPIKNTKSKF